MDCGIFLLNQQSDISILGILNNLYGFIQSATLWVFSSLSFELQKGLKNLCCPLDEPRANRSLVPWVRVVLPLTHFY